MQISIILAGLLTLVAAVPTPVAVSEPLPTFDVVVPEGAAVIAKRYTCRSLGGFCSPKGTNECWVISCNMECVRYRYTVTDCPL